MGHFLPSAGVLRPRSRLDSFPSPFYERESNYAWLRIESVCRWVESSRLRSFQAHPSIIHMLLLLLPLPLLFGCFAPWALTTSGLMREGRRLHTAGTRSCCSDGCWCIPAAVAGHFLRATGHANKDVAIPGSRTCVFRANTRQHQVAALRAAGRMLSPSIDSAKANFKCSRRISWGRDLVNMKRKYV